MKTDFLKKFRDYFGQLASDKNGNFFHQHKKY